MSTKDDGGPAFPCTNEQFRHGTPATGDAWPGLSLRDWFAGQALAGMCANPDISKDFADRGLLTSDVRLAFAASAYRQADEMLAARDRDSD